LTKGVYDYKITFSDHLSNFINSISTDTFIFITSSSGISITHPSDINYLVGTHPHEIAWIINSTGTYNAEYNVSRDDIILFSGSWHDGSSVAMLVDDLAIGTYEYNISASDGLGGFVSDSVMVTVNNQTMTNTTNGTSSTNIASIIAIPGYNLITLIPAFAIGVLALNRIFRKKMKNTI
jgi:hypothetical protein